MASNEKELIFTTKKCPACSSTKRLSEVVAEKERQEGRLGQEVLTCMMQTTSIIADPRKARPFQRVPIVTSIYDVCGDCGCFYCVRAEKTTAVLELSPSQPPPDKYHTSFGMPPFPGLGSS